MKKLKVGIFSFTGDEGCVITFTEILNDHFREWKDLVEFRFARALKKRNVLKGLDVAFVEGAMSSPREVERLREVRRNCKKLVAIGSCAINGSPSNHRNFFDKARMDEIKPILRKFGLSRKVKPLGGFVKVDSEVPGCPIVESAFVEEMGRCLEEFGIRREHAQDSGHKD